MRITGQPPTDGLAARRADDAELARLLDRRSPLSEPLREAVDADGPPGPVDAAIRAAARRAVAARPQPLPAERSASDGNRAQTRRGWQVARLPLAAAAILVLTVSMTLLVEREQRTTDAASGEALPGAAPLPVAPATVPATEIPGPGENARAPMASPSGADRSAGSAPARTEAAPSVEPMEPAAAASTNAMAERPAADEAAPTVRRSIAPMAAPARPAPPPPPPAAPRPALQGTAADSALRTEGTPLPPDRWLQQILDLRSSGRMQEATEALAAFRKA